MWSVGFTDYTLYEWTADGTAAVVLQRRPTWFARESIFGGFRPDVPPPSLVVGLAEDPGGLLWTGVRVPAKQWQAAWHRDVIPGQQRYRSDQFDPARLWETMIEVIDPGTARVVSRKSLDGIVVAVLEGQAIALYTEDEQGEPHLRIVRLALARP